MSLAEQLFSIQDSTLSMKAELEQRHSSLLAPQLPVLALPMQFSAQAGLKVSAKLEEIALKNGILGRDWRFQLLADAAEKDAASARRATVKRILTTRGNEMGVG